VVKYSRDYFITPSASSPPTNRRDIKGEALG
jgi:hypothetical protein